MTGELDPKSPLTVADVYTPILGLDRIEINNLPTKGHWWYLPVRIIFNPKQSALGYALYDASKGEILDLHLWNKKYGQISAMYENENNITLEDCDFFKDDKLFRYELLLDTANKSF